MKIIGIHSINNIELNLEGANIIGGVNGTRKSTIIDIIYSLLKISNTTQKEVILSCIDENIINTYAQFLGLNNSFYEEELLRTSDGEETLVAYNSFVDKIADEIDYYNEKISKEDENTEEEEIMEARAIKRVLEKIPLEKLDYKKAFEKWQTSTGLAYFSKYDFQQDGKIILEDNMLEVVKVFYKNGDLEIEVESNTIKSNHLKRNKINHKNKFESIDRLSTNYFFNKYKEESKSLIENFFEDIKIKYDKDNKNIKFSERELDNEYPISRVATGFISFTYIDMMYRIGNLKEGDFLILDEPDVHLHTKWQVIFVELLKKLKEEGVNIILTTHNSLTITKFIENELGNVYIAEMINNKIELMETELSTIDNKLLISLGEGYFD